MRTFFSPVTLIAWMFVLAGVFLWGRRDHCEATGGEIVAWECVK